MVASEEACLVPPCRCLLLARIDPQVCAHLPESDRHCGCASPIESTIGSVGSFDCWNNKMFAQE